MKMSIVDQIKYDRVTSIVGTTEYGKSYFTKKTLLKQNIGVLYFNMLNDPDDMEGFTDVDGNYKMSDIFKALEAGMKLNYCPSYKQAIAEKELMALIKYAMDRKGAKIWYIIAVEEIHLIKSKELLDLLESMSFAGRHFKIRPIYITQRPQVLPRGCITQSTQLIMFSMQFEDSWLKTYKIDPEFLDEQICGRKYFYCRWTPLGLEAAKML